MFYRQSAPYYEAFYGQKEYRSEALYVHSLISRHMERPRSLLDLGCGSGSHARHFHSLGYLVHGVDSSEHMVRMAQPGAVAGELEYSIADIRSLPAGRPYDAVTALFHVMDYMTDNSDFSAVLDTAFSHLAPGGILVFDFWYGPAVLLDPPRVSVRRVDDGDTHIFRVCEPCLEVNENVVRMDFSFYIRESPGDTFRHFCETHRMRYFFLPELDLLLEKSGFARLEAHAWMTMDSPGQDTRYACVVAGKRGS